MMFDPLLKRRLRALVASGAAMSIALGGALLVAPAHADVAADASLAQILETARTAGFLREFHGQDQVFNGSRSVEIPSTGKSRLRSSAQGTIVVRFKTTTAANQVILAGGSGTTAGAYGAILANGVSSVDKIRVDFPNGMVANLNGPAISGDWHTFAYSVNATTGGTTARTVTSIDGSATTQFPNYASWFNANQHVNLLNFLTIGGAPAGLANSSNNVGFAGRIGFVGFVPTALTQSQAASVTSGLWSGASSPTKVFSRGDATGSDFFRIPFLLNTRSGSLLAGTDANFGSTGDSGENIDAAIRRKPNAVANGASLGWSAPSIPSAVHMRDYADESGYKQSSASVIDGAIVQDTRGSGRIFMIIDLFAWNGGVFEYLNVDQYGQAAGGRNRSVAYGDGFASIGGRKYLLLSNQNVKGNADGKIGNINNNTDRARFNYVADVNGPVDAAGRYRVYALQGTPQPYSATAAPVSDANLSLGALSAYSLDAEFVLYQSGVQQRVQQKSVAGGGPQVPMKIFYEDSTLQVYNTSYLLQTYSDDDGQTWVSDQLISGQVKRENSRYYVTGPGKAIQLQRGTHAGRLVVPVYYQGGTSTEVIYSDDSGETWQRGAPIPSTLPLHESTVVELPNGSIQIFVRHSAASGGKVVTATSTDGGATWRDVRSAFGDNDRGIGSQVSGLELAAPVLSPTTGTLRPALIVTTAMTTARTNGVAHVGLIHPDGSYSDGAPKYRIEWINQYPLTGANEKFAYSSMAQLADGRIGLLYESSPTSSWADGLQSMYYRELNVEDVLE